MHLDHLGGLVAGGRRNFPNAESTGATGPTLQSRPRHRTTCRTVSAFRASSFEPEIVPGVSIVDLTGHTPGHIGVRIKDAGQGLTMVSDMLFPVVHPGASDVSLLFEQDRPAAQAMRTRFFPRAADDGALIAATHMPFPGLGRIVSESGGLRWLPAEWALQG